MLSKFLRKYLKMTEEEREQLLKDKTPTAKSKYAYDMRKRFDTMVEDMILYCERGPKKDVIKTITPEKMYKLIRAAVSATWQEYGYPFWNEMTRSCTYAVLHAVTGESPFYYVTPEHHWKDRITEQEFRFWLGERKGHWIAWLNYADFIIEIESADQRDGRPQRVFYEKTSFHFGTELLRWKKEHPGEYDEILKKAGLQDQSVISPLYRFEVRVQKDEKKKSRVEAE